MHSTASASRDEIAGNGGLSRGEIQAFAIIDVYRRTVTACVTRLLK